MNGNLPAFAETTSSEVIIKHLNALYAGRKICIQTKLDERIQRALRNKVRASEQTFKSSDRVFYKRKGKERWLGQVNVVFQDGNVCICKAWTYICWSLAL